MSNNIEVLIDQGLDVPNILKDVPNFVNDVLNFVKVHQILQMMYQECQSSFRGGK